MPSTIRKSHYVLESPNESQRLDRQSAILEYSPLPDVEDLKLGSSVLDAGCGSGELAILLSEMNPLTKFEGWDASSDRVEQAGWRIRSKPINNIKFRAHDLRQQPTSKKSFDTILCRFVMEHLSPSDQKRVCDNLFYLLNPGGTIRLIDVDGLLTQIYPLPRKLEKDLVRIRESGLIDCFVGRKLKFLLESTGVSRTEVSLTSFQFTGERIFLERELMRERLNQALPILSNLFASRHSAETFIQQFLELLSDPQTLVFYNKFRVTGYKSDRTHAPVEEKNKQ